MRRLFAALFCLSALGCGSKSPTNPTPNPPTVTETRIIRIAGGPINFGGIEIGQSFTWNLQIANDGNSPLNVTGITGPGGTAAGFVSLFTSGTIPAGGVQTWQLRFTPTVSAQYNGTVTVASNATSGTNTVSMTAFGRGPTFVKTGTGNTVFDLPFYVNRVRIEGNTGLSCQNLIVHRNGGSVVNAIIGTCSIADSRTYDGTHLTTGGGVIEILSSEGVNWAFTEQR